MQGLMRLLATQEQKTKTGIIVSRAGNEFYSVKIGGGVRKIKSAMNATLPVGAGVVVAETSDGAFIIGKDKMKNRKQREVTING